MLVCARFKLNKPIRQIDIPRWTGFVDWFNYN